MKLLDYLMIEEARQILRGKASQLINTAYCNLSPATLHRQFILCKYGPYNIILGTTDKMSYVLYGFSEEWLGSWGIIVLTRDGRVDLAATETWCRR